MKILLGSGSFLSRQKGFTLLELLAVIFVLGILTAIALPSFLAQSRKAKNTEALQYIASIVRLQQVYYQENGGFTDSFTSLDIGISPITKYYTYELFLFDDRITLEGETVGGARITATPADPFITGYRAKVWFEIGVAPIPRPAIKSVVCKGSPGQVPNMQNKTYCPQN